MFYSACNNLKLNLLKNINAILTIVKAIEGTDKFLIAHCKI